MTATLTLCEAYDRWAEVYPPVPHNPLMEVEQAAVLGMMGQLDGLDVLDLACGSGRYGAIARLRAARFVVGIDRSRAMLSRAGIASRLRADLTQLPLRSGAVDLVISGLAIGHATALDTCMREIARVLRPGGALLYSDFHDEAWRAGLTRSFRDARGDGVTLPRDGYPAAAHAAALRAAGFVVEQWRELRVGIEFTPAFKGGTDFYRRHHGVPLLLIARARKAS